jgi:hypothetical protein
LVEVQDVVDEGARLPKGPVEIRELVLRLDPLALPTHHTEVLGELLNQGLLVVDVHLQLIDLLREDCLLRRSLLDSGLKLCDLVPKTFVLLNRLLKKTQLEALLDHVLMQSLDSLFKLDCFEFGLVQLQSHSFELTIQSLVIVSESLIFPFESQHDFLPEQVGFGLDLLTPRSKAVKLLLQQVGFLLEDVSDLLELLNLPHLVLKLPCQGLFGNLGLSSNHVELSLLLKVVQVELV